MEYLELGGLDKHLRSRDQETKVNYGECRVYYIICTFIVLLVLGRY